MARLHPDPANETKLKTAGYHTMGQCIGLHEFRVTVTSTITCGTCLLHWSRASLHDQKNRTTRRISKAQTPEGMMVTKKALELSLRNIHRDTSSSFLALLLVACPQLRKPACSVRMVTNRRTSPQIIEKHEAHHDSSKIAARAI